MVLISIQPFALRKILLILVAVVGFSALCFADPVLMAEHYAPKAGFVEATTNQDVHSQEKTGSLFQDGNQAQFDALRPVDLPSRDQRVLPMWKSTSEAFRQDDSRNIFRQTA
jgi:hypothetical protein